MLWFELTCICHPPFAFHPLLPNLHQQQQQQDKRHQVVKSMTAEVVAAVAEASQTVINNSFAQQAKQHEGHKACC